MNRVLISLLKGTNNSKLALLNKNYNLEELIDVCEDLRQLTKYKLEKGYAFNRFNQIVEIIKKMDIKIVTLADNNYPPRLKNIYDPPFILYLRGDLDALEGDLVSVVGTRKPSLRGFHESFKLGLDLGRKDVAVVSGLALGVDAAVQSGNVATKGRTIAVLGGGVDTIYPSSNKTLAGNILKNRGAIISEFPPGEEPKRFNFPKRNRIIAGLSNSLIIMQAPKKSGALITGDFALQNGTDIYIHSVGIGDSRFTGSDRFYKDGATKIDSAYPILKTFFKAYEIKSFDSEFVHTDRLLKMELDGEIIKYKGCFFNL
ncbi:MAG: DNA-processing protein DprA [Spirochaetaceae bacterium]